MSDDDGTVASVTDHILITGLRVVSVIGVLEHERQSPQPLRVDIDIHVDLNDAGRSDDLSQTVHYGEVSMQIAEVARNTSDLCLNVWLSAWLMWCCSSMVFLALN